MSKTFDQSKDEIAKLCQYFTTNRKAFFASGVKEAHIRQSLIDPFFEALGWDMRNASMAAPQYREVITEDSLDVEGQQKAPDYTFRVGTLPKFYVEAKKCGVNINIDMGPAYQLRRYGFSAKLALSILTDFEELGVYDCASRPRPIDKASHARIQYFGFSEYPDRWREIWDIFSREAVWSGSFDQYVASKRKRGTSEVDSEFLKDIEGWRDVLARNLAIRNNDLSTDDLNAAVQKIIDRIIFLRMAEDRGLESYGQLLKLCEQPDIYNRFMDKVCQKADQKYNSGLFHFEKEAGVSEAPDSLTPDLTVDDNVLKPILQNLYFEHGCPYHFGVLPVEILGTVYERFLGKVIRLTAGHQAKVEEKPEVRKAGGVYYTPAYIVNYIVQNTVGKQVEGKSPVDLAGGKTKSPFRVLDMACGSGSFLLGAYQFLLDHCLKWYLANPSKKYDSAVYQNSKGETHLTIGERKRILTTHIYGVDIDRQAVETTKLSLLLKALEGENDTTLSKQMTLFHERALPNLSDNIKCGNSLIASDFSMLPEDLVRVNAFDWPAQFPDAMKSGGFDAIIGNPPYIPIEAMEEKERLYYQRSYSQVERKFDTSIVFILRALRLVKRSGFVGYISSITWETGENYSFLRKHMFTEHGVCEVLNLPFDTFKDAYVDTGVYILHGQPTKSYRIYRYPKKTKITSLVDVKFINVDTSLITAPDYRLVLNPSAQTILIRASQSPGFKCLGEITKSTQGLAANRFERNDLAQSDEWYPFGEDVQAYRYELVVKVRSFAFMHNFQSLKQFYAAEPKILIRRIINRQDRLDACLCDKQMVFKKDINPFVLTIAKPNTKFVLGVINSRLLSYLYVNTSAIATKDDFRQTTLAELRHLPIPITYVNAPTDKQRHDKLVGLVEKMLALTPKLRGATAESEKAALQNAVTTTDAEIDRLVYQLYGLTKEEIKIVEGKC
ncbi:MAG: N-6 DNA methylase [Candidatus Aminicenantes bacterium]|nr:N-6 DNA methylase [Candidatus Aminicenantes bacterium]